MWKNGDFFNTVSRIDFETLCKLNNIYFKCLVSLSGLSLGCDVTPHDERRSSRSHGGTRWSLQAAILPVSILWRLMGVLRALRSQRHMWPTSAWHGIQPPQGHHIGVTHTGPIHGPPQPGPPPPVIAPVPSPRQITVFSCRMSMRDYDATSSCQDQIMVSKLMSDTSTHWCDQPAVITVLQYFYWKEFQCRAQE